MNNEYIFVVTEAYIRGEKAAEYAMENNFSLFDLKAFFEQRKPWATESERQHFFDGFWTAFRR